MAVRVVWVSFVPLQKTPAGATSTVASVRYRLTIPAAALAKEGCDSRVTFFGASANQRTMLERFNGARAVVLGKLLASPADFDAVARRTLELVNALRTRGTRVMADYSDDHFASPTLGEAYRALANAVDVVVASTPCLADVVKQETSVPVRVITDPVEGMRGEPRACAAAPLKLLWFGHPSNLDTLKFGLPQLETRGIAFSLTMVTSPGAGAEQMVAQLADRSASTGSRYRFTPWSIGATFRALDECDAVVIPSNPHDPRKAVKSPNRFTEALWAGCFVIAHPLPAYQPLAAFGWVGEDLGEGLAWLLEHPQEAIERIHAGQTWIAKHCSREAVAAAWKLVITASG